MIKKLLKSGLKVIKKVLSPKVIQGVEASRKIIDLLESDKPCMVSRFGSSEIQTLVYWKYKRILFLEKSRIYYNIQYCAGFFPINTNTLRHFYEVYKGSISKLDLLASWRFEEIMFKKSLMGIDRISLDVLDSFGTENPWTQVLKGKKVLVVSPFNETIEHQYKQNRTKLFEDDRVLPKFELITIKSIQSLAGETGGFQTWFDALDYMKEKINQTDFDIAILGCGAYGMPLAAHVKDMGKKAVHVGGATQILFGVKGKRWERNPIINEYFMSPSEEERPQNAKIVEGGCYW